MAFCKRGILSAGLCLIAGLASVSAAWACTYQPSLFAPSAVAGPRGTEVTVTGQNALAGRQLEIRWNGVRGDRLAEVAADDTGRFSARVTVPEVAPGVYYFVAVSEDAGIARSAFEVTSSSAAADAAPAPPGVVPTDMWAPRPRAEAPVESRSSTGGLAVGMGLLSAGIVVLTAGSGVAVMRRRRAGVRIE